MYRKTDYTQTKYMKNEIGIYRYPNTHLELRLIIFRIQYLKERAVSSEAALLLCKGVNGNSTK